MKSKIKYDYNSNNSSKHKYDTKYNKNPYEIERQELLEKNMNSSNSDDIIRYTDSIKRSPKNVDDLSLVKSDSEQSEKQKSNKKSDKAYDSQYQTFGGKIVILIIFEF